MGRLPPACALLALVWAMPGRGEPALSLTAEEQAYVAEHPVVRVGFGGAFAPYSFPGPDGKLQGLDIDYLNVLSRRTGLQFEPLSFGSWPTAIDEVKAGRLDMLTALGLAPEREAFLIYTLPYTQVPNVIVTRTDTPYIIDLRELKGRRIGVSRGYAGLLAILRMRAPGAVVVEFDDMDNAFETLAHGGVDGVIADVLNASWEIKALHLANLRLGSVITGSEENYMGVRRSAPVLAGIVDKAIASISAMERKEIDDRWIGVDIAQSHWARRFKWAAAVAVMALLVGLIALVYGRRLSRELAARRRVQAALEEAHTQLARVSEEKSALLHMVAHDLRSPLTAFQLGAELLRAEGKSLSEHGRETLGNLEEAVQLMRRLVDDLVDVHMLEEGRRDFHPAEVDACGLVRESVAAFTEAAARKQIQLAFETGEASLPLRTDAKALRQVVDNLISNAVKYSPARSEVRIDLSRNGSGCRLRVRDAGPGVRPEERERIFEKYTLGSARPTGGEKATGLGLWIVRRVVTGLHGRVWVEDAPGAGAAFVVEMPLSWPVAAGQPLKTTSVYPVH